MNILSNIKSYKDYLKQNFSAFQCRISDTDLAHCDSSVDYAQDSEIKTTFLMGTNSGLLAYVNGHLKRILPHAIYGITKKNKWFYVLQRRNGFARILRFLLNDNCDVENISIFVDGLSVGIHQIDFIGSLLFVTDTYNNSFRVYRDDGRFVESFYPSGQIKNSDIMCGNYCHYNSVFARDGVLYAVAHNNSLKSSKESEIHKLDMYQYYKIKDKIENIGLACHNVIKIEENIYWCDSLNSAIKCNHEVVSEIPGYLTRGMAINNEYMIVGGSAFAFGEKRLKSSGCIAIFNREYNKLNTIKINESGGVSEIRFINGDYGLSSTHLPSALKII